MRFSWKISKYLIQAVLPYFIFAWLLLSVILFIQQAGRFSDIFFSVNIPASLIWQLSFALVPNVIAFTCPMAVLVGVIIGLTKMQADSELVAIRAAGVGNLQIAVPMIVLGILLSIFAFFVNLKGVPAAAAIVRQIALTTAIQKLESPIEPGVFNSEVAGYTIYVKEGDIAKGVWKDIFVFSEDAGKKDLRLITASEGRIDFSGEESELILENAVGFNMEEKDGVRKYYSERIGDVRYAVDTKRGELVQRLSNMEMTPDELGLSELAAYAMTKQGKERIEAQILWQRRIILSISPLVFCLFGTALVLRYNRKGRGFAIVAAMASLILYYLLAFLGEQLARTGRLSVFFGSLIPIIFSLAAVGWLGIASKQGRFDGIGAPLRSFVPKFSFKRKRTPFSDLFLDLTTGLRDFDTASNLVKYFFLSLFFLAAVFLIFTAFELWKYAGTIDDGIYILLSYLFFLLPFLFLQLAPSSAMIATLATYVIKSRQNEIVTWIAAGQSIYRLLVPCMIAAVCLGIASWQIQERIAPKANRIQDEMRDKLRSWGRTTQKNGKQWTVSNGRIFSFRPQISASDNASAAASCFDGCVVSELSIYEFDEGMKRLQTLYRASQGVWKNGNILFPENAEKIDVKADTVETSVGNVASVAAADDPFVSVKAKPSHMNAAELRERMERTTSVVERRSFDVELHKKYTTPFLPFVIALFTAPFSLSLSRTGKAATVSYAVALWLVFMGVSSTFQQMGLSGSLPPAIAVWSPLALWATVGIFLLSRIRT